MHTRQRKAPLPGLTALRFFAASYVLLFHLFPVPNSAQAHPTRLQHLLFGGSTGVSCFFILSGFILAYTHPRVPDRGAFLRARFARIYPLYLLGFAMALPNFLHSVYRTGPLWRLWAVPASLLLVQGWYFPISQAINTPAWTLSCEGFFYVLFPFLIGMRFFQSRHPLRLLALLWGLQILPPILVRGILLPHYPSLDPAALYILFTPLFHLGEFLAGIALGMAFLGRQEAAVGVTQAAPFLLLPFGLCFLFLSVSLSLPPEVLREGWMLGPYCFLIWCLATVPSRLMASKPLQLGGEISYGVYLLQDPLNHWLYTITSRIPVGFLHSRYWILTIYPFAWAMYVAVEKPCRNWLLGRPAWSRSKPIPTPQPGLP